MGSNGDRPVGEGTIEVTVDGQVYQVKPKVFSSGSTGWHLSAKQMIDGRWCQLNVQLIVCYSSPGSAERAEQKYKEAVDRVKRSMAAGGISKGHPGAKGGRKPS